MKIKILFMSCLILLLGIGVYSASKDQKTIVWNEESDLKGITMIAKKVPKFVFESDDIARGYGTACYATMYSEQEVFEKANVIINGEVQDVYSYAVTGGIMTIANVEVTDSIKGNLKKGDVISVTLDGGYATIEQLIKSYDKEDREEMRKWYGNLTDQEMKNKYTYDAVDGDAELREAMEGVFCLIPSRYVSDAYGSLNGFGDIYMKLPNGKYRRPRSRSYEELAEISKLSDEEMEQKAQQMQEEKDYLDNFQADMVTYEEIMEKINWSLLK